MTNYQSIRNVNDFESLIEYLRDELDWNFDNIEDVEDALYEYEAEDFGLDEKHSAKISGIKQIIPFIANQPWGIFWIDFGAQKPSVVALRGLLRGLVKKKRESANESDRQRFALENLLFILTSEDFNKFDFAYFRGEETNRSTLSIFGWEKGETHLRTLSEHNLPKLRLPIDTADTEAWLKQWREAFDVEKITQKFFERYEEIFRAVEMEIGKYFTDSATRTLFTQRLFNRLMFLYFVQKKGWLKFEGNNNYLQTLFQKSSEENENFYDERLQPLFFNGLNTPKEKRDLSVNQTIGDVEFLNGGLFERDADGFDAKEKVKIPNHIFEKIFNLFAQYNFTVEESTPIDVQVAVDPEMLGKVFEELVTGRHASGSYYTPRPVVSFMCRESLKHYLSTYDSAETIAAFVDEGNAEFLRDAEGVFEALKKIRVCDPACGSGAYILGMLQELMRLRTAIFASSNIDDKSAYRRKREIIETNLYGVDKDNFAVQVARLRLWLALAIESDVAYPLPNLDYKIGGGDSLLAPIEELQPNFERNRLKDEFRKAKDDFTEENDSEKKKELREQVEDLRRQIAESLDHAEKKAQNPNDIAFAEKQRELKAKELQRVIREGKKDVALKWQKELNNLDQQIAAWKIAGGRYDSKGIFDWTVEFLEVFDTPTKADSGFDVVLANPPYVQQEDIDKQAKPKLLKIYAESMTGKSDLFVAFYTRGLQMLKSGGMHVFVCSNSWLDVGYGGKLQSYLLDNSRVTAIYDSAIERQFATAKINTIISFIRKQTPTEQDETKFVSLRAPFTEAIADDGKCRIVTKSRQELAASGSNENGKYEGDKWGGKFLRAPDIYFTILEKGKDKLVQLSKICIVAGYIHDNNTGSNFPEVPFLKTIKKISQIYLSKNSPEIINFGVKSEGNSRLVSPLLFPRTFGNRHIVVWNPDGVFGKEFYKILPKNSKQNLAVAAQMNDTFTILQRELIGLANLGDGALKFSANDVEKFLLIENLKNSLIEKEFLKLSRRNQLDIYEEIQQPDRRELDAIIFDALGLTAGEREAVYEAVVDLVSKRLQKANTISS